MKNTNEISILMKQALNDCATPGISYALEDMKKKTVETSFLGYKTYDKKVPLKDGDIYDLASLTKVVGVTSRILQLLGKKIIDLDDKVSKYFPQISYPDITVKNLLLHNSGLAADLSNVYSYANKDEVIAAIFKQKLIYPTGTDMVYSDLNFILLGMIIEKVDEESLDKSLEAHVFKPLEMANTGYCLNKNKQNFVPTEKTDKRGLIQGEVHDETAYMLNGVSGNAGLFSTIGDLKNFCRMYLQKGKYKGKTIIPSDMIDTLFNYNFMGRTLGWQRWNKNSKTLWHTGFTGTSIALDLDHSTFFICLTNRVNPTRKNQKWINVRRLAVSLFFNSPEQLP
ncbi:serine hydrolase domain-containing protein [Lactobacillus gasseri]|uniref:serine hydrolase domain-containing protein n=1 Tax=Lactobacillus gasseri TaxID=1596 RepID=UPI001197831E|nr:serine hydrolase domain-containing protein [Lactobacillus gasseri]TVU93936.1 beta-lactamase family protein [Lactobacillus gasseri]TVV17133.1 beta-lactamase family protein [Lactobacillus gasseri]